MAANSNSIYVDRDKLASMLIVAKLEQALCGGEKLGVDSGNPLKGVYLNDSEIRDLLQRLR